MVSFNPSVGFVETGLDNSHAKFDHKGVEKRIAKESQIVEDSISDIIP